MYPVSQDFQEQMIADKRQVFARVMIDYTSPFLDESISVSANEQANVSFPMQTADSVPEPFAKIASLDGSWELDGSYALAPATAEEAELHQVGWWGKQLAGTGGAFLAPYPTLTVTFFPRPITRLQVIGDSKRGEYPVDFAIRLYGETDLLLHTETVTGNTGVAWSKTLEAAITQVTKMELEVSRWSHDGRQAKILEFFMSIQEVYEGDDIILIHLLEEREVSQGSLPVGVVTSNELDIRLDNSNRKFDAGNTASPLHNLLKPNRRIRAWLGVETGPGQKELVPLGTFWSGDWSAPEDGIYAQTTGRDRLEMLRRSEYISQDVRANMSLYDLAVDILTDAGLTPEEYWVDDELKDYIIPYVALEPQSHREALRKVAEACLGQVYCDRLGVIRVEGTKAIAELKTVQVSEQANISYPEQVTSEIEEPSAKWASLDGSWVLDGSYQIAPTSDTDDFVMGWWGAQLADAAGYFGQPYPSLSVSFATRAIGSVRVVGDSRRGEYPVDFSIIVYDDFSNVLARHDITGNTQIARTVAIPENPTTATKVTLEVKRWSHPGRQAKVVRFDEVPFKLEITPDDYFRKDNPARYAEVANYIEVTTQPIDSGGNKLEGTTVIAKDDDNITENGLLKFEFPENPLVQTVEMAQEIADRLLAGYKDAMRNLELEWRGNPALLLGDVITVQDNREQNDYRVARQEIEYSGALRAQLSGRRVV